MGVCLVSQEIRELVNSNKIITGKNFEERIQPSSFEPVLGDELFILDTETKGMLRPKIYESVYKTLLQLPARQRKKQSIANGFEIKKSFTYLLPLEEKIILEKNQHVKSSPKSTFGRGFQNTRLLADYTSGFDEIPFHKKSRELDLWLLVQPFAFNFIIYPGMSLNQIRIFNGYDAKLTDSEIAEEFKKNPLLYLKKGKKLVKVKPVIAEGLQIHLDLLGKNSQGIVGLRARHNPEPIDTKEIKSYNAEDFFEPIKGDKLKISAGEYYLFSSKEILNTPKHLSMELKTYSNVGFAGPMHFAGFVDNWFRQSLVFEIRSDELSDIVLEDGMPISKLDLYRTNQIPDKLYGKSIGSNYSKQKGPTPPKFFKGFNFAYAAKNYKKLKRNVLTQDAKMLLSYKKTKDRFEILNKRDAKKLYRDIEKGFFHSRYDCEADELVLQPIPYVVLFGPKKTVFVYERVDDIKQYGERRLFGKLSVGVGGHICENDAPEYINNCLKREVTEEEVKIKDDYSSPKLVGTMVAYDEPVDRVHFGMIFKIHTSGKIKPNEESIVSSSMVPIDELMEDIKNTVNYKNKYETWSWALIPHLNKIYKL